MKRQRDLVGEWYSVHSDSFLGTSQNLEILRQSPQDWVTVTERSVCQQTFQLWKEVEEEWPAWGNVCLSKTDNISKCTYLHQVLSILVKARLHISRLHVKQDFDIRIKIYVHVSRCIKYMKSNKYWSSSSYTDRQSYPILIQSSRTDIKIRIFTSKFTSRLW